MRHSEKTPTLRARSAESNLTAGQTGMINRIKHFHQLHGLNGTIDWCLEPMNRPDNILHLRDVPMTYHAASIAWIPRSMSAPPPERERSVNHPSIPPGVPRERTHMVFAK